MQFNRGHVIGARHGVVHQRTGEQLAFTVVHHLFQQGLANALGGTTDELVAHQIGLQAQARVIHPQQAFDAGLTGGRVHRHAHHDTATGPGLWAVKAGLHGQWQRQPLRALRQQSLAGLQHRAATNGTAAAGQGPGAGRAQVGVAHQHLDLRQRHPQRAGSDVPKSDGMALALIGAATGQRDAPIGMPGDAGRFPALTTGLHIHGHAQAHPLALGAALALQRTFLVVSKVIAGQCQQLREVARIQGFARGRAVGHGTGMDQVAQAQLHRVQAQLARGLINQGFHQQSRLGPARAAVNAHWGRVRTVRLPGDVAVWHLVRPGQDARGIAHGHQGRIRQPCAQGVLQLCLQ